MFFEKIKKRGVMKTNFELPEQFKVKHLVIEDAINNLDLEHLQNLGIFELKDKDLKPHLEKSNEVLWLSQYDSTDVAYEMLEGWIQEVLLEKENNQKILVLFPTSRLSSVFAERCRNLIEHTIIQYNKELLRFKMNEKEYTIWFIPWTSAFIRGSSADYIFFVFHKDCEQHERFYHMLYKIFVPILQMKDTKLIMYYIPPERREKQEVLTGSDAFTQIKTKI